MNVVSGAPVPRRDFSASHSKHLLCGDSSSALSQPASNREERRAVYLVASGARPAALVRTTCGDPGRPGRAVRVSISLADLADCSIGKTTSLKVWPRTYGLRGSGKPMTARGNPAAFTVWPRTVAANGATHSLPAGPTRKAMPSRAHSDYPVAPRSVSVGMTRNLPLPATSGTPGAGSIRTGSRNATGSGRPALGRIA